MNILVIGGSGHVSGAVTSAFFADRNNIFTVTRGIKPLPKGVKSLIADRHDIGSMEKVISDQNIIWDLVVDCICFNKEDMLQDISLFKERAKQFVFISTDFVYNPGNRSFPQDENAAAYIENKQNNISDDAANYFLYGVNKRNCEELLISGEMGDVEWTILRPCHIYGPTSELGCFPLHGRDPELIDRLQQGEAIKLVGGGHFLQQPIFVDDLAGIVCSIPGNKKSYRKIFNTAGPDIIESWQYYQIIADILGVELKIEEIPVDDFLLRQPDTLPFICHRIYDHKSLEEAGLKVPSTTIREGLKLHVDGLMSK